MFAAVTDPLLEVRQSILLLIWNPVRGMTAAAGMPEPARACGVSRARVPPAPPADAAADEAKAWREWLLRAVAGKGSELRFMYGVPGERRLPETELPWLPGYKSSRGAGRQRGLRPVPARRVRGDARLPAPGPALRPDGPPRRRPADVRGGAGRLWDRFRGSEPGDEQRYADLDQLQFAAREAVSPLHRLEVALHPWVAFAIMPVFALANAGVPLAGAGWDRPHVAGRRHPLRLNRAVGVRAADWVARSRRRPGRGWARRRRLECRRVRRRAATGRRG